MSSSGGIGPFRILLTTPGALRMVVPAAAARASNAMSPLAVVLHVQARAGSFGVAGTAAAGMALAAAVVGPTVGRWADRRGPAPVVAVLGCVQPLLLAAMLPAGLPAWALVVLATCAGVCQPPVGASVRVVWTRLLPDESVRATAFALEAVVVEVVFVAGPAAVGALAVLLGPTLALTAALLVAGAGALGYASAPVVRALPASDPSKRPSGRSVLREPGVPTVLAGVGFVAAAVSVLEVALPATVAAEGRAAGFGAMLVALPALGSAIGGLAYGARAWAGPPVPRYVLAVALILVPLVPVPLVAPLEVGPALVVVLLFLAGLPMAPASVEEFTFLGRLTEEGRGTEVFAWAVTTMAAATALGNAVAGWVAESITPTVALALAPLATVVALAVVGTRGRKLASHLDRARV